jgi:hypothetical protein
VTVAPAAFARGAGWPAKVTAALGVAALAASLLIEHRRPEDAPRARAVAVWGLSLASAFTWLLVPSAMTTLRVDVARGFAGVLGWGLFAFTCAAPPVRRDDSEARVVEGPPLRPRTRLARGDVLILALGGTLGCGLQVVGWHAAPVERAVLVRLVVLACGIAVLGAATSVALARHIRRTPASSKVRWRRSAILLATLGVLFAGRLLVRLLLGH